MTFETKLNYLKELFTEKDPNEKYNNNMKKILIKMKAKAEKLEVQLENEKNEEKRKNISLMLKVIAKQQKKGEQLMRDKKRYSFSSTEHKAIIKPELSPRIILGN